MATGVVPAHAAERPERVPEIAGEPITGTATIVLNEKTIDAERVAAVASERARGLSVGDERKEDSLIAAVEKAGGTLDEDVIDVVPLLGGDVTLTVPVDVEIDKITLTLNKGLLTVDALSSPAETSAVEAAGPGMVPHWINDGDGAYVITISGWGDGLFTWARSKLADDGSAAYTWYAYKRKGDGHPFPRFGYDARVQRLRLQNFPFDSVEPNLVNWNEWDPAVSFSGQCDGGTYNVGISVFAAEFGTSFQDCDRYTVWRNANKPSSYWIEMDQGQVIHGGDREIGYAIAWKQKNGTAGSQHDFQRLVLRLHGVPIDCSHTDAGDTC
ncbi:MAG: hypothetical protein ACRCYU_18890 [Nocardioides sp.]